MAHRLADLPQLDSDAPIASRPRTRMLFGALVGALVGFLVGFLASSYACGREGIYYCYPTEWLKIGLVIAAGLVVTLLVSRLWPSMTSRQKNLMTIATLVLLTVLVVSSYNRFNPWECPGDAFCQVGDAVAST